MTRQECFVSLDRAIEVCPELAVAMGVLEFRSLIDDTSGTPVYERNRLLK